MESKEIINKLNLKGIRHTPNRILVYRALADSDRPMSLNDLENSLLTMDKSSIFRVLTLFREHGVLHDFEDGRGVLHYELCMCDGECDLADNHLHFYCEHCQKSFCLNDVHLPEVPVPEGYSVHSISFVVKGCCPQCQQVKFGANKG